MDTFAPVQRLMARRTRSTLPLTKNLLTLDASDPQTISQEITRRLATSKSSYEKSKQPPLPQLPVGSYAYAKLRPTEQDEPWIYCQITDSSPPHSYSLETVATFYVEIAPSYDQRWPQITSLSIPRYQRHCSAQIKTLQT